MMKNILLLLISLGWATIALADPASPDDLGGRVEAKIGKQTIAFPALKTDIQADVQGDLSTISVIQTFANPLDRPINATYLFPLNKDAAVYEMIMQVSDETVHAQIQRVEEAKATFASAKAQGKSAALLTLHRPNMFTQDIANLMPGMPIRVTLRYVQTVPKVDGLYELVVPLVVGPRFQPPKADNPGIETQPHEGGVPRWDLHNPPDVAGTAISADSRAPLGQWELEQLPAYPPVSALEIPSQIDAERVSLTITLNGGMPIAEINSDTHAIISERSDEQHWTIALADGRTLDNRDFVLRYRLAGETSQAGLLAYRDTRGGFFSLLIEPPQTPSETDITPREMVFLLDCSGSMNGLPMAASKAFMRQALRGLRPTDHFRIIRFSDAATEFSSQPLPATPDNIRRGITYTDGLRGSGGTMMTSGIRQALQAPIPGNTIRLVTFLTDGYIGNELEVLRLLQQEIGPARLFAFGVGAGVNRYLLSEMGRVGRGFTRYMDPTENVESVATELAQRLQSPVLTDIAIDWGELQPTEINPGLIPDLFAGQSLRVQGRYAKPGRYQIKVQGRVNGRRASLPLAIDLPEQSEQGAAVALIWARSAIKEAMYQLTKPQDSRSDREPDDTLKQRITQLGLDFSLVTQWTAFVAVSEVVYNTDPEPAETLPVPLPQVKGVSHLAYGKTVTTPSGAATSTFSGHVTPEPEIVLGMLLMAGLLGWFLWRQTVSTAPWRIVFQDPL